MRDETRRYDTIPYHSDQQVSHPYIHTYICAYSYNYIHTSIQAYIHIHTYIQAYTHTYILTSTHPYIQTGITHTCIYIPTHIQTCIHTCMKPYHTIQ